MCQTCSRCAAILSGILLLMLGMLATAFVPVITPDEGKAKPQEELRRFEGHKDVVWGLAFAPDGKSAVSASYDKTIRLWDIASGKEIRQLSGHAGSVLCVAYATDGRSIISGGVDKTVRVWDLSTGKERCICAGHGAAVTSVAISADGKTALSGSADKSIRWWDLQTAKEKKTLVGHKIGRASCRERVYVLV